MRKRLKRKKIKDKRRIRVRLPLPEKSGGPHGSPGGKKSYDRKSNKEVIKRELDE
jgi:hypothetical protein